MKEENLKSASRDHYELLLYPELLSKAALISELQKRLIINSNDLYLKNKDDLIELVSRICMPCPQRQYNDQTRRGKEMNRQRAAHKRKSTDTEQSTSTAPKRGRPDFDVRKKVSATNKDVNHQQRYYHDKNNEHKDHYHQNKSPQRHGKRRFSPIGFP